MHNNSDFCVSRLIKRAAQIPSGLIITHNTWSVTGWTIQQLRWLSKVAGMICRWAKSKGRAFFSQKPRACPVGEGRINVEVSQVGKKKKKFERETLAQTTDRRMCMRSRRIRSGCKKCQCSDSTELFDGDAIASYIWQVSQ